MNKFRRNKNKLKKTFVYHRNSIEKRKHGFLIVVKIIVERGVTPFRINVAKSRPRAWYRIEIIKSEKRVRVRERQRPKAVYQLMFVVDKSVRGKFFVYIRWRCVRYAWFQFRFRLNVWMRKSDLYNVETKTRKTHTHTQYAHFQSLRISFTCVKIETKMNEFFTFSSVYFDRFWMWDWLIHSHNQSL